LRYVLEWLQAWKFDPITNSNVVIINSVLQYAAQKVEKLRTFWGAFVDLVRLRVELNQTKPETRGIMVKSVYTIDKVCFELILVDIGIVVCLAKIRDATFCETESILANIEGMGDVVTKEVPGLLVNFKS